MYNLGGQFTANNFQVALTRFSDLDLEIYLEDDWVLNKLQTLVQPIYLSDKWLQKIPAKRMMFSSLYKDLFEPTADFKCLDVGSGQTRLLPQVNKDVKLTLLEPLPPPMPTTGDYHVGSWEDSFLLKEVFDWDLITSNDVFPNVDNRIVRFLESALPRTQKLVMTLTAHNAEKEYLNLTKSDGEVLAWQPWDSEILLYKLSSFFGVEFWKDLDLYDSNPRLFEDKRSVYLLKVTRK